MQPVSKLTKLIHFSYITLFLLTPLLLSTKTSELFEFPKLLFVYTSTIIITTLHVLNIIHNQIPFQKKHFINIPIFLFLISQIISTIFSIDPHTSIYGYYSRFNGGLLSTISYILLFLILNVYINDKLKNQIINSSLISGFIISTYGVLQHFGIDKNVWVQDVQNRVFSTLGQPNWLAAYLCILIPIAIHKFLQSLNSKKISTPARLTTLAVGGFHFSLFTFYYLCLLFTKSKSGIIACLISLGIYFFILLFKNKSNLYKQFLNLSIPIFIIISSTLIISNPIKSKLFPPTTPQSTPPPTINITTSEDIRKIVWNGAVNLWKKHPIIGTGVETFAYSYYWTRPKQHNLTSEWDFIYNKAHNEYLNFAATTGTLGILTYLLVILSIAKNLSFSLPLFISFISILITNFAGFSVVITSLYFFLIPCLLTTSNQSNQLTSQSSLLKYKTILTIICLFISFKLLISVYKYYQADLNYNISQQYDNNNQYQQAYNHLNKATTLRLNEPTYLSKFASITAKLAIQEFQNNNQKQAETFTQKTIENLDLVSNISPANINFIKERAQTYYYLSSIDTQYFSKALQTITQATILAPTDAKSFYILARFWETADNLDETIKNYQKAIELKENYDHAHFALAKIYYQQENFLSAKDHFEKTLKIAPNNTEAQQYLDKIGNFDL
ncbi:O-antigen ligase family protein [Patescibacteria group bacterium]|nr:O-antigen ligase family protein [Patescibacteria group bacterium]MBU4389929.1 O-antigen ligase family protein [Patescibacteria group bacterium]MBU4396804.1 O-antigen ligase family protein [Patescibacteria group bacterium]MBU4431603.1 O-antigen ligase family protein [Patescibacteria group bacterium]MCG2701893.1 O-antigen ligase family protein [Candidatus Parcubacteria bacterium]